MKRLPLKLCPKCGLYHDISMEECTCGADLRKVPAMLTDMNIPAEKFGEIDEELEVYVQRCSACGTDNFTDDPAHKANRCWNCHKPRIGMVTPVLFEDAEPEKKPSGDGRILLDGHTVRQNQEEAEQAREEAEDDIEAGKWAGLAQSARQSAAGIESRTFGLFGSPAAADDDDEDDEDDDEEAAGGWGKLLGGVKAVPQRQPAAAAAPSLQRTAPVRSHITLTALRGGSLNFSLTAGKDSLPYMLGRSANQSRFLAWDLQVGNNHCSLNYTNGTWTVFDNNTANGTAVNGAFLDPNETRPLRSGDRLMLGHRPDSPEFRVLIEG